MGKNSKKTAALCGRSCHSWFLFVPFQLRQLKYAEKKLDKEKIHLLWHHPRWPAWNQCLDLRMRWIVRSSKILRVRIRAKATCPPSSAPTPLCMSVGTVRPQSRLRNTTDLYGKEMSLMKPWTLFRVVICLICYVGSFCFLTGTPCPAISCASSSPPTVGKSCGWSSQIPACFSSRLLKTIFLWLPFPSLATG